METIKDKYIKFLAGKIMVIVDDLTDNELSLITESFELFSEKLDDIKILNDELKRISIELANLKAMYDDSENDYED
jgi:hypothetical protein